MGDKALDKIWVYRAVVLAFIQDKALKYRGSPLAYEALSDLLMEIGKIDINDPELKKKIKDGGIIL